MMTRCGSVCPTSGPKLTCTLPHGHEGRHQAGHFGWWEPVKVFIGGKLYEHDSEEVTFSWEK